MKLYFYGILMLIKKFIFRQNTGTVIRWFASKMGVVYIKFAQLLAMQNYGDLFTESDRQSLSKICDDCNKIKFKKIKKILEKEYKDNLYDNFLVVYEEPLGSASISQVHKGILKNGKTVAIKIKRKDVTKKINKDVKQLKKLVKRFGWIFNLKNMLASSTTFDMFMEWIITETDFVKEKENILRYHEYALKTNKNIENTIDIVVPYVYKNLCTENVIVMEYINYPTINKMVMTDDNKLKISKGLNDYFRLSFSALFKGENVVFHGDPHGGNIYLDNNGNIGFLDMGLLFELDNKEVEFIRSLFLNAYNNNCDKLIELILNNGSHTAFDYEAFTKEINKCCQNIKNIPVPTFFMNMIGVFTKYNIDPPHVVYKLAKCFISFYGINNISENEIITEELLFEQIAEYYVNRTITDFKEIVTMGISLVPNLISTTLEQGLTKGIASELSKISTLSDKVGKTVNNCNEIINIFEKNIQK